jgi:aspartate 1-decarboxylase
MLQVVRAKLHGIHVTGNDLNYHGSITLDPDHCTQAGIRPLEFVDIFNKNNGARWYTYVIYGAPGSQCCVLNGPSARNCQEGDSLVICASTYIQEDALYNLRPKVLTFNARNDVEEVLHYEVHETPKYPFDFRMVIESQTQSTAPKTNNVDRLITDLRQHGVNDHTIADIIAKYFKSAA